MLSVHPFFWCWSSCVWSLIRNWWLNPVSEMAKAELPVGVNSVTSDNAHAASLVKWMLPHKWKEHGLISCLNTVTPGAHAHSFVGKSTQTCTNAFNSRLRIDGQWFRTTQLRSSFALRPFLNYVRWVKRRTDATASILSFHRTQSNSNKK